jgi:CPA2 family monovalent cation:H+ antiporter-2
MEHGGLTAILTLLGISVVVVAVFRRCHLPPILGYLFIGVVTGPHALHWLHDSEIPRFLGEIGVVFLLFAIGLEFSIPQFIAMKRILLGLGGAQVLVGTVSGAVIAWALGIPWQVAIIVGGAFSMSSTAIVIKQLTDQVELHTVHGRLAIGVLLFQDLAAVPFLVMIPILAGNAEQSIILPLSYALLKGITVFTIMLACGHWLVRPLFREVAASRSAELFTLTVLLVSLAAAWLTSLLGLSLALGAFLAGMMLSETEFRHQIEADIRPFRDVLLGLFFVTVGMQLDLAQLPAVWPWVVLMVLGLIFGKGPLIILLTRLAGYENDIALRTGTVLAHGGEFGFALLTLALYQGLLSHADSQPILAAIVISMGLAPMMIRYNDWFAKAIFAQSYHGELTGQVREIADAMQTFNNHVIICGFGRIGQNMASFLRDEGFAYVALDLEPDRVRAAWEGGERVFYGDATQHKILEAAGIDQAKALIISFNDEAGALKILHIVRSLRNDLPVLVRSRDDASLEKLLDAGATEVVPETLEASLMLAIQLLLLLEVPLRQVVERIRTVRSDRYHLLRVFFRRTEAERSREAGRHHERLSSVYLPAKAYAVGLRLADLGLEKEGIWISALRRGETRCEAPDPNLVLRSGDVLVLGGTPEQLAHAEERLLMG